MVVPADLDVGDDKARAALERYRIQRVTSAAGRDFDQALAALEREFAPRGEIERREVIADWLSRPGAQQHQGLWHRYHLLAARDADGKLAGARDAHTVVDAERKIAVVYLAHVLVVPAHRRKGLSALLRAAPISLGRDALAEAGAPGAEILLAAEMEPASREQRDTLVRLVAYGRAGFRAISPAHLPYCQPDFRDPMVIGDAPRPLPLLAIVRRARDDGARSWPRAWAEAYLKHLYAVFGTHCRQQDLERPRAHALEKLSGHDEVPLLPLPESLDDSDALAPLWREAVLPHHLPELS
jgi:GNAT superfamily N-acetyltransferase